MQANLLPQATTRFSPPKYLERMEKRGNPVLGQRLKQARERLHLSQQAVADAIRVGRSTITGIETAHRPVGRETLVDLAEFFRVPVDYFTHRDELMATALWVLCRLPQHELEAWVTVMTARATGEPLPPRD